MDYAKEKSDWQDKPELKVAEMVSTLDGHIANCPPRCKGACDLSRCPLGKGNQCMHRHLTETRNQLIKTPLAELVGRHVAAIEKAQIEASLLLDTEQTYKDELSKETGR